VSSLTVRKKPWAAFPSCDTTVAQIAPAILEFNLAVDVTADLVVYLKRRDGDNSPPPSTDELALAMYGEDDHDLLVAEETGEHQRLEQAFEAEAKDRHEEGV